MAKDILAGIVPLNVKKNRKSKDILEDISPISEGSERILPISEALKDPIQQSALDYSGNLAQHLAQQFLPASFSKGYGHGVSRSFARGTQAAKQLAGIQDNFPQIEQKNPESLSENIGNILGQGVGYSALSAPFVSGGEAIGAATGVPRILSQLLSSSAAGASLSPNGERTEGALEFAAPILGAHAIKGVFGSTASAIAKKLSKDKQDIKQIYKNAYSDFFQRASDEGIHAVKVPRFDQELVFKYTSDKQKAALKEYLKNPTLENAHWAQSELGHNIRPLRKLVEQKKALPQQIKALDAMEKAQNRIKANMFAENQFVTPEAREKLSNEYNQKSKGYAKDVIPYHDLPGLSEYEAGRLKPKHLLENLESRKSDPFLIAKGHQYPEIMINKALKSKLAKVIGGSLAAGLGFKTGYNAIK